LWCGAQSANWKVRLHLKHHWIGGEDPQNKRKTKSAQTTLIKAIACPCKHIGVIKFLAIHLNTLEAYTLRWNGSMLWKMLDYNTKYPPILSNQVLLRQKGLDMEGWTQLVTFRKNCVKIAWAIVNIMNAIHHYGILHNDL